MDRLKRDRTAVYVKKLGFKEVRKDVYELRTKRTKVKVNLRPAYRPEVTINGLNDTRLLSGSFDVTKAVIDLAVRSANMPGQFGKL